MKEVVQHYGVTIIAMICALGIFTLIYYGVSSESNGFFGWLGQETLESEDEAETISISQETVVELKTSEPPTLTAATNLKAGTAYKKNQLFSVVDSSSNSGDLSIICITDASGNDVTSKVYSSSTNKYTFSASGVYAIKLTYWDNAGVSEMGWAYLCIN